MNYDYIKQSFRITEATPVGFTGLRFKHTFVTRRFLSWHERWASLNQWRWREFLTGERFVLDTAYRQVLPSRYASGVDPVGSTGSIRTKT
jgi:hypothetical protein